MIGCIVLNRMAELGKSESQAIVGSNLTRRKGKSGLALIHATPLFMWTSERAASIRGPDGARRPRNSNLSLKRNSNYR